MIYPAPILTPLVKKTYGKSWYKRLKMWLFDPDVWELREDYIINIPVLNVTVLIPRGFRTDFASIPKAFHFALKPGGILLIPAIVHDWIYRHRFVLGPGGEVIRKDITRSVADDIFRRMGVLQTGMHGVVGSAYYALKAFGWIGWSAARKNETGSINLHGKYDYENTDYRSNKMQAV
jgi:hypothetical protein